MLSKKEKQDLLHLAAVLSSKEHQQLAQEFAVSLSKDTARLLRFVAQVAENPKSFLSFIIPSTVEVIEDQVTLEPQSPNTDPFSASSKAEKEKEKEENKGAVLAWRDSEGKVTGIMKQVEDKRSLTPLCREDFENVYAFQVEDQFILVSHMKHRYGQGWPRYIVDATLLTYEEYVKKSTWRD